MFSGIGGYNVWSGAGGFVSSSGKMRIAGIFSHRRMLHGVTMMQFVDALVW